MIPNFPIAFQLGKTFNTEIYDKAAQVLFIVLFVLKLIGIPVLTQLCTGPKKKIQVLSVPFLNKML